MIFDVAADAYGRFMGRWSEPLADGLVEWLDPQPGQRVLDVGCGPGALTARLVDRLGADAVAAVEPSAPFVEAVRARFPDVDVQQAPAESLPYGDGEFDLTVAQLVVHFMANPVVGLSEMRRVTKKGGRVVASVWDHGGGRGPLSPFWNAVHALHPAATDESGLPGSREGDLSQLFHEAGFDAVDEQAQAVTIGFTSFEDWWQPFTLGVGPAGAYVARLDDAERDAVREQCRETVGGGAFELTSAAWTATALA